MAALTWTVALLAGIACVSALGVETTVEEYPSIVQVEDRVGTLWLQQCSGSVLTSYHVITTASCMRAENLHQIRAGSSIRGVGGQVREISSQHNHPTYGLLGNEGDLCIVRLLTPFIMGANIQQASILGEGIELPNNLGLVLVGFGTTTEGGLIGDSNLYKLDLINIEYDECMERYLVSTGEFVTENMICAGLWETRGRDLDSRDAGSPMFYQTADSTTTVGILSFGATRSNDEMPLVSTAIASYTNWIVETASTT